jgi:hypothetical protein
MRPGPLRIGLKGNQSLAHPRPAREMGMDHVPADRYQRLIAQFAAPSATKTMAAGSED